MSEEFNKINQEVDKEILSEERIILSVNSVLKMEEVEEPYLIDGMVSEQALNALTSDSGKGKSLFMLKMVEAIVRGQLFLGKYKTKQAKTLIIDLEMNQNDIIQRTKSIIQTETDKLDFYTCQEFNIEDKVDFAWLLKMIKDND